MTAGLSSFGRFRNAQIPKRAIFLKEEASASLAPTSTQISTVQVPLRYRVDVQL